ncbi:MAG: hypothetical protein WAN50_00775 [Minisyncoccia bacterium]
MKLKIVVLSFFLLNLAIVGNTVPAVVFAQTGGGFGSPDGSTCTLGSDCESGVCTNGICASQGTGGSGGQSGTGGSSGSGNTGGSSGSGNTGGSGGSGYTAPTVTLTNPLGTGTTLNSLLTSILGFVVQIGSIIVVLMLVYVGFLFVTAQGNDSKLSQARNALLWTVIGALILLGAQGIALGIQATAQALSTGS